MDVKLRCLRCSHEWESRLRGDRVPKACPSCKRYDWNKELEVEE